MNKQGIVITYDKKLQLKSIDNFQREYQYSTSYDDSNFIYMSIYKNGKLYGEQQVFYNHHLYTTTQYVNDMKHGIHKQYRIRSVNLEREDIYFNNQLQKTQTFWENTQTKCQIQYDENSMKTQQIKYYQSGQKKCLKSFRNEILHGLYTFYSVQGIILYRTTFSNGNGVTKSFYENNQLKNKRLYSSYLNESILRFLQQFYENGQIKREALWDTEGEIQFDVRYYQYGICLMDWVIQSNIDHLDALEYYQEQQNYTETTEQDICVVSTCDTDDENYQLHMNSDFDEIFLPNE